MKQAGREPLTPPPPPPQTTLPTVKSPTTTPTSASAASDAAASDGRRADGAPAFRRVHSPLAGDGFTFTVLLVLARRRLGWLRSRAATLVLGKIVNCDLQC